MIVYRGQGQFGCGGCLLVCVLLVLVVGGLPALVKVLGFFLLAGLALTLAAGVFFWAVLRWLRRQDGFRHGASFEEEYRRIFAGRGMPSADRAVGREARALAVLGLSPGAGEEDIRRAYRSLSMECHPDRVRHLEGEALRRAEERMKEINAAYDFLRKRGSPDG